MNNSVHGHEVLQFMLENEQGFASKDSLKTAIETRFGATVRFHTCSADGLTAEPDAPAVAKEEPQEDDPFASLFAKGEKK